MRLAVVVEAEEAIGDADEGVGVVAVGDSDRERDLIRVRRGLAAR